MGIGRRGVVGTTRGARHVRWGVAGGIVWAWILTIPMSGGMAYGLFRLLQNFGWA